MKYYVIYDPSDGRVLNRFLTSREDPPTYLENCIEISPEEASQQPEINKRVNLQTKTLEDK